MNALLERVMKKYVMLTLPLLIVSGSIMAEDGIKSSVESGLIFTSGNTDTRTVNIKGKVEHTKGKSRNTLSAEALYVDGDQGKLSEKYLGEGNTAYQFAEKTYAYANAKLERDLFSGYDYQGVISTGLGYRLINDEVMTLDLEAGPGYRQIKLKKKEADGEFIGRIAGKFAYNLGKKSVFTEEITSEISSDAAITKSVTAVTAQVVGNMAMKVSLTIKHNSGAPSDVDKIDSETALTLVYTF